MEPTLSETVDQVVAPVSHYLGMGFNALMFVGNIAIWVLVIWFLYKLSKRFRIWSKETFMVLPQVKKLREALANERNLENSWTQHARAYVNWVEDHKMKEHPYIYGHELREVFSAFLNHGLYPPETVARQWYSPVQLREDEYPLFVFNPWLYKIKNTTNLGYDEGICDCVLTNKGLYIRYGTGFEYISNKNFAVIETYVRGLRQWKDWLFNRKWIGVQKRQPPCHMYQLRGKPWEIDYLYKALTTGWNAGPKRSHGGRNNQGFW